MRRVARTILIAIALVLIAAGGFAAWHWEPDRSVEALAARWAPPPSQFITVGDLTVHVRSEGPMNGATPIVLLHGTGSSLHTWDGWTEALREDRRVIRFDLPGFGLTGPNPDGDYSLETYADFVADTMEAAGVERAVVAGNSLGGRIAWMTAAKHPDRVAGLVLVDASAYVVDSTSVPIGFRLAQMPVLKHALANVLPRHVVRGSVENVYGDPSLVTPELVDRYFELTTREGNRRALVQRLEQLAPGAHVELIPTLRQPTLILWGGRDRLIPHAVGERLHREIPDSRLIVWGTLGHVPQEEDPSRTVEPVLEFLSTL